MGLGVLIVLMVVAGVGGAVLGGLLLVALVGRRRDPSLLLLQQQIEALREQTRQGLEGHSTLVNQQLGQLASGLSQQLGQVGTQMASQLSQVMGQVNERLKEGALLVQQAHQVMGERLDQTAKVVGEVQGSLGRLDEGTQRMIEVGRDIASLQQILQPPKLRGGLGETLLEHLLAQILPQEHYTMQYTFRSGERVDAVVRIGPRLVPIDAKFPLDNFRRMLEEPQEEKKRAARRAFGRDVRARIGEIANKYILPDEGTFEFALMYIPAENIYYETIIKEEEAESGESLASLALRSKVIPVSPNSFYAYLQAIVLGLKGLRIEGNAREIMEGLIRLQGDLRRLREHFDVLDRHLTNAKNKFDEAEKALGHFEAKLEGIGAMGGEGHPLPAGPAAPASRG